MTEKRTSIYILMCCLLSLGVNHIRLVAKNVVIEAEILATLESAQDQILLLILNSIDNRNCQIRSANFTEIYHHLQIKIVLTNIYQNWGYFSRILTLRKLALYQKVSTSGLMAINPQKSRKRLKSSTQLRSNMIRWVAPACKTKCSTGAEILFKYESIWHKQSLNYFL